MNLPEPYARPTPASVIRITRRSDEAGRWRGASNHIRDRRPEAWFSGTPGRHEGDFYGHADGAPAAEMNKAVGAAQADHSALLAACALRLVDSRTRPVRSRRQRRMRHTRSPCSVSGRMDRRRSFGKPPWFTSLPASTTKMAIGSAREKPALLSFPHSRFRGTFGSVVKDS